MFQLIRRDKRESARKRSTNNSYLRNMENDDHAFQVLNLNMKEFQVKNILDQFKLFCFYLKD